MTNSTSRKGRIKEYTKIKENQREKEEKVYSKQLDFQCGLG